MHTYRHSHLDNQSHTYTYTTSMHICTHIGPYIYTYVHIYPHNNDVKYNYNITNLNVKQVNETMCVNIRLYLNNLPEDN